MCMLKIKDLDPDSRYHVKPRRGGSLRPASRSSLPPLRTSARHSSVHHVDVEVRTPARVSDKSYYSDSRSPIPLDTIERSPRSSIHQVVERSPHSSGNLRVPAPSRHSHQSVVRSNRSGRESGETLPPAPDPPRRSHSNTVHRQRPEELDLSSTRPRRRHAQSVSTTGTESTSLVSVSGRSGRSGTNPPSPRSPRSPRSGAASPQASGALPARHSSTQSRRPARTSGTQLLEDGGRQRTARLEEQQITHGAGETTTTYRVR